MCMLLPKSLHEHRPMFKARGKNHSQNKVIYCTWFVGHIQDETLNSFQPRIQVLTIKANSGSKLSQWSWDSGGNISERKGLASCTSPMCARCDYRLDPLCSGLYQSGKSAVWWDRYGHPFEREQGRNVSKGETSCQVDINRNVWYELMWW